MGVEVVTKEDLQQFRLELLNDLRQLLESRPPAIAKPWLKNAEVMKLLNVSANTIQRLRIAGKLRSNKVGGTHFYRYEDIEQLLNSSAV
ncbi:helix-turn-helix domain-containing protein [Terrimonas alba]|uniref:helix-turn-helix domain-containing protein n=1 Tax=Terrimonas alba TaxID=3349636 RepID=UPI0035F4273D